MSRPIMDEIADMKSVQGEYVRLMAIAITDGLDEVFKKIDGKLDKTLDDIVLEIAIRCYEISNADFEENFNPHHGEEQGGKPF